MVPAAGYPIAVLAYVRLDITQSLGVEMKQQQRLTWIAIVAVLAAFATACGGSGTGSDDDAATGSALRSVVSAQQDREVDEEDSSEPARPAVEPELQTVLDDLVAGTDLPSIGVTMFDGTGIIETGVAGVRRSGDPTLVEVTDRYSIGSNAKAMTAFLVATFVDDGLVSWDTTIGDVYGDGHPTIDPSRRDVTLRQLLDHTGGLDDDLLEPILTDYDADAPVVEQRADLTETILSGPGQGSPGRYQYSNLGYTMVGAILEELTGVPWENLMEDRVFGPLGMDSCGFTAPGTPGEVDQPWGHLSPGGQSIDPGHPEADLPGVIAPAGVVHCSMADWTLFLQSQLRGFQGSESEIISPEAFSAIQAAPQGSDYALGWVRNEAPNGVVTMYHHGSNERFTAEVWLIPSENRGLLTVTNLGKELADPPLQQVNEAMFARLFAPSMGGGQ